MGMGGEAGSGSAQREGAAARVPVTAKQDPRRYKLFGIYWWPMKDFLKAAAYGKDQLYMLADYRDAITADLVPAMRCIAPVPHIPRIISGAIGATR
jgi:hypothetical protein